MKFITKFILLFTILSFLNCLSEKEQLLRISGKTVGTDTKSIILVKPNQDTRFDSIIEIPVIDGKFHYESKLDHPEYVTLFLTKDLGRFMPLFLENEKIDLTIYPEEEFDKNIVEGGKLNDEYRKYKERFDDKFNNRIKPLQDIIKALFKSDEYNSDKTKLLYTELKKAKDQDEKVVIYKKLNDLEKSGENLSPKAKELDNKIKPIYEEQKMFQQNYIESNPNLVSYSFLLDNLIFNKENLDVNSAKKNYKILSDANPTHPYNELASNLINAIENIKIGKKYTDFSAPDLNGTEIKLSEKINGKIALLDLWATWCGPCIAKSRTMVPLYNEYKDKGFTIIGVAGEFKNTDRLVKFLEKEKWEWTNLVELDRQNNIWQKYGVDGGGGGIFLIDENGLILAKDPTAEEVRIELESRLN
ncbi:AhpC/TSA family protein [Subsaxibacter sp. CAU 1640]|uniref:TlpA disulfide reductase family protein n=1 Tax=Subsaxibacter sp. CAU 1640 TaxID=2933271 RepID=UPI0020034C96|nr:TlpA disulfide reductase family protein [Subsaxibacter sp. CAU 1640]MCK7591627.1 AhpC/TSA family protein [Subsaxibacter sp. CAU 1640]